MLSYKIVTGNWYARLSPFWTLLELTSDEDAVFVDASTQLRYRSSIVIRVYI